MRKSECEGFNACFAAGTLDTSNGSEKWAVYCVVLSDHKLFNERYPK